MQYLVELEDGSEHLVSVRKQLDGSCVIQVDAGPEMAVELQGQDGDGAHVVVIDGVSRSMNVIDRGAGESWLVEGRDRVGVRVSSAGEVALEADAAHQRDDVDRHGGVVRSPITGVVIEVVVQEGQRVREGEPVIVVEAMKMENSYTAPRSGVVSRVAVAEGETVFVGDILVELEHLQ